MNKNSEKFPTWLRVPGWVQTIFLLLVTASFWVVVIVKFPRWFEWFPKDPFEATNSLFSGLALAGVIWAIITQRKQIEFQQKEIEDTQTGMQEQKRAMQKETFERTFFQLLEMLDAKRDSLTQVFMVEHTANTPIAFQRERLRSCFKIPGLSESVE